MTSLNLTRVQVPLDRLAFEQADRLAAEQATVEKGQQIYLNVLAVWAVHTYLGWLGIPSKPTRSESWQVGLSTVQNVADLEIPNVGRLECRPVLPGAESFTIPLEATRERLGYVAVQFHESLEAVDVLGFMSPLPTDALLLEPPEVNLPDLLSIDALLNALHPVKQLRHFLEGLFESDQWHPTESLVAARFRRSVPASEIVSPAARASQAKRIELGDLPQQHVVLVVDVIAVSPEADVFNVWLRLYPSREARHLPRQLKVAVSSDAGVVLSETQTRDDGIALQLELLDCHLGERFSVQMCLPEISVSEEFMV